MYIEFGKYSEVDRYFSNGKKVYTASELMRIAPEFIDRFSPKNREPRDEPIDFLINTRCRIRGRCSILGYENGIQTIRGRVTQQMSTRTAKDFGVKDFDVTRQALRHFFPHFHNKYPIPTSRECFHAPDGVTSIWSNLVTSNIYADDRGRVCIAHRSGLTFESRISKSAVIANLERMIPMLCLVRYHQLTPEERVQIRLIADLSGIGLSQLPEGFDSEIDHAIWENAGEDFFKVLKEMDEKARKEVKRVWWGH